MPLSPRPTASRQRAPADAGNGHEPAGGYDVVIACDWSAAQGRSPTPRPDRCWLAWGLREHAGEPRAAPEPAYCPTRREAEARVAAILTEHVADRAAARATAGGPVRAPLRALVGFDFAIGYPLGDGGAPVLPVGRALCALLAGLVRDDARGMNNRFEAADALNAAIRERTGLASGPFWGRPASLGHLVNLPRRRPRERVGLPEHRQCERACAAALGVRAQSPFKLLGAGSVGSQSLVGLPAVHRLLAHPRLGPRCHLWPFEPEPPAAPAGGPAAATAGCVITIAEIYPSIYSYDARGPDAPDAPAHWCKDARQVLAARRAMLAMPAPPPPPGPPAPGNARPDARTNAHPNAAAEGWILGVPWQGQARRQAAGGG